MTDKALDELLGMLVAGGTGSQAGKGKSVLAQAGDAHSRLSAGHASPAWLCRYDNQQETLKR